jgi:hypothetical protein
VRASWLRSWAVASHSSRGKLGTGIGTALELPRPTVSRTQQNAHKGQFWPHEGARLSWNWFASPGTHTAKHTLGSVTHELSVREADFVISWPRESVSNCKTAVAKSRQQGTCRSALASRIIRIKSLTTPVPRCEGCSGGKYTECVKHECGQHPKPVGNRYCEDQAVAPVYLHDVYRVGFIIVSSMFGGLYASNHSSLAS